MRWLLSSSSDPRALAIVDGTGRHDGQGPHYSRCTPGAKIFTGCGPEIVLVTEDQMAVWAVIHSRKYSKPGSGTSRGRRGADNSGNEYFWRNMMFRNLGPVLSSDLIRSATERTYEEWRRRYGELPAQRLRTEIGIKEVRSTNPGCCYKKAGWSDGRIVRGKLYLYAPVHSLDNEGTHE